MAQSPEQWKADVAGYLAASPSRACAVAKLPDGRQIWGMAVGRASKLEAASEAMEICEKRVRLVEASAKCALVEIQYSPGTGAAPVKPALAEAPVEPARTEPAYSERWVDGREFAVGAGASVQVWIAVSTEKGPAYGGGSEPRLVLTFVNAGVGPLLVNPETIVIRSLANSAPLKVYSPAEYETKVKFRQGWIRGLNAFAAGYASQAQPRYGTFQGQYGTAPGMSSGYFTGTFVVQPSLADQLTASARASAQMAAVNQSLQGTWEAITGNLLKRNTLDPGAYYGGTVFFEKSRDREVEVTLEFGQHLFTFKLQKPQE
jgi:hypothetical protein